MTEESAVVSLYEAGDYLPTLVITNPNRVLDLHGRARERFLLLVTDSQCALEPGELNTLRKAAGVSVYVITRAAAPQLNGQVFYNEPVWHFLGGRETGLQGYLVGRNLKIDQRIEAESCAELLEAIKLVDVAPRKIPPPVLMVPNAITPELGDELVAFFREKREAAKVNDNNYKSRTHVQTNEALSKALDTKLVRAVLPEIHKVLYSKITYRETYKICLYDGESGGKFGAHRDTVDSYRHRRYAMSLALNDDYVGGGISFPEYNDDILRLDKYSALIFPGSLFHEVQEIEQGERFVIISFFFGDKEAAVKENSAQYKFTTSREVDEGVVVKSIVPFGDE